jgi:hypothetical protein
MVVGFITTYAISAFSIFPNIYIILQFTGRIVTGFYQMHPVDIGLGFMMFNTTFNNISVISWWSVLMVKETTIYNYSMHTLKSVTEYS